MLDLFGDTITTPAPSTTRMTSLINLAHGFPEFWKSYPSGPRKAAKQQCLDKWARYKCANSATLILLHLEWMKNSPDWQKDGGAFICAPLVYLNKQGWIDFEPASTPKRPERDPELIKRDKEKAEWKPPSATKLEAVMALKARINQQRSGKCNT